MARMRALKPEFWHDRKLARSCSRDARMLYMGLWNQADEWARGNGDPAVIKGQVFPFDDVEIEPLLAELCAGGWVVRYDFDGDPYLFLPKLDKHQRLEPVRVPSRLPEPPDPGSLPSSPPPSERGADESARDANTSERIVTKHVAGSREHVAGSREHVAGAPAPPVLRTDPDATVQQRAEPIVRAYYDAMAGMCKWPAVLGIVKTAIKTGKWDDAHIYDALMRLAGEGRTLTVDTLRIECDGLPARASPRRNGTAERNGQNVALVHQLEAEEAAAAQGAISP